MTRAARFTVFVRTRPIGLGSGDKAACEGDVGYGCRCLHSGSRNKDEEACKGREKKPPFIFLKGRRQENKGRERILAKKHNNPATRRRG